MQQSDALEEALEEAASSCATRALARVASESYGAFDGGIAVEQHAIANQMVKEQWPSTDGALNYPSPSPPEALARFQYHLSATR
ncbi:hypothetical protein SAMN02800691_0749 [Luteibacter sp. UNCMF366Tsu5.1]|nr:hypothetical protein SAMN02800691_0749 [Luteibacter sp. UNCMF366Tsu5.1]